MLYIYYEDGTQDSLH